MANVNVPVAGWPAPPGAKNYEVWDHYGPTSYVQYAATSTPAGDIVNAADLGFGGFDEVSSSWSAYSNSGNYIVQVNPCLANDIPAGGAAKRFTVQWFTTAAAFGAKSTEAAAATNLSAEYVRLKAFVV
jgi:hypothetical protein